VSIFFSLVSFLLQALELDPEVCDYLFRVLSAPRPQAGGGVTVGVGGVGGGGGGRLKEEGHGAYSVLGVSPHMQVCGVG
jgi:hypothetical protein